MKPMRVIVFLAAAFLVRAALAQSPGAPPWPVPGRMVDLGGYRVHVDCTGSGEPAVMIAGAGFSFDWSLVQPAIAQFTRVCTYDPSGMAWSDPGPGRGCPAWVNEVHELVKRAPIHTPMVMAGLSAGAVLARLYAERYPAEISGLVLIDHAFLLQPEPGSAAPADPGGAFDRPAAVISMTPVIVGPEDEPGFLNLPKPARELDRWARLRSPDLPTPDTTAQCMAEADANEKGLKRPLGQIPLTVISTNNDSPGYGELQRRLLALSRNSTQAIASKSFHSVELSEPEVVVEAIRRVVEAARNAATKSPRLP